MKTAEPKIIKISEKEVRIAALKIATVIEEQFPNCNILTFCNSGIYACSYIIKQLSFKPRLLALDPQRHFGINYTLGDSFTNSSKDPLVLIDDIIDSGNTVRNCFSLMARPEHCFFLVDKRGDHRKWIPPDMYAPIIKCTSDYIQFPWEI